MYFSILFDSNLLLSIDNVYDLHAYYIKPEVIMCHYLVLIFNNYT